MGTSKKMTSSKSNLLLVAVAIAVVMTLDHVPSAEGDLMCYLCHGDTNTSTSGEGKQDELSDDNPSPGQLEMQAYREKVGKAMPCKDLTATTQKEDRAQIRCPFFWEGSTVKPDPKFAPMNTCPKDAEACKCNRDFCNGLSFGVNKADRMNDSVKRVVVGTLLGVSFFVRGYLICGGGDF
ncbi:hypothetical protein Fcan01_08815 [Folsomia candida]|uniref:Protein sleepless n=1 Tax=Folsomia candida TaxID=158441 RepID=A0A226EEJ4_FOLCA|nr:hypothetical protein Fcan01_08815 [Folsomia candida]